MKPELDEKALIESVLLKDREAFEKLIRRYEGLVLHIVLPLIKNEKDREDICQDVFLKVHEKLHAFQFRSKLSTWIGNIAYNTSINHLKKKKNVLLEDIYHSIGEEEPTSYENIINDREEAGPESILIGKEEVRLLEAAVAKLPPVQKTILLLFHQDELSLDEISEITGMLVNTVKSHLFRARKNLKTLLVQHRN